MIAQPLQAGVGRDEIYHVGLQGSRNARRSPKCEVGLEDNCNDGAHRSVGRSGTRLRQRLHGKAMVCCEHSYYMQLRRRFWGLPTRPNPTCCAPPQCHVHMYVPILSRLLITRAARKAGVRQIRYLHSLGDSPLDLGLLLRIPIFQTSPRPGSASSSRPYMHA
jgi:hypothetical protein